MKKKEKKVVSKHRPLPVLIMKLYIDAKGKVWGREWEALPWATADELGTAAHAADVRLRLVEKGPTHDPNPRNP
jgi:hypothetical protein